MNRGLKWGILFLLVLLLLCSALGAWFLSRPPVLMVMDPGFVQIYGEERIQTQARATSFKLLRRIIPVVLADTAGPDLYAIAIEAASGRPWAVFFLAAYDEAARYYQNLRPEIPVFLIGPGDPRRNTEALLHISPHRSLDLYRAGAAAAIFSEGEGILFFGIDLASPDEQAAFTQGLRSQGYSDDPLFTLASEEFSYREGVGAIVLAGGNARVLEAYPGVPVLLFSWANPSWTPGSVKIIFDDSPWGLLLDALSYRDHAQPLPHISSGLIILEERIEDPLVSQRLREALLEASDGGPF
ncbi:MAG: hypothetical protein FWH12_03555 [Treponema sp.]|nr:hypothetical protein [Treponema sp.]